MIILASTSTYRRTMLERLDLPFLAVAPTADETQIGGDSPEELVMRRARLKAESLQHRFPKALIIGSDQAVCLDGEVMGKPGAEAVAIEQLTRLQGRSHQLLTGLVVLETDSGRVESHLEIHQMRMRGLSEEQINVYVRKNRPFFCAGSYMIERLGIALFDAIEGSDDTAIVGLPMLALVKMFDRFGVDVIRGLWRDEPLKRPRLSSVND